MGVQGDDIKQLALGLHSGSSRASLLQGAPVWGGAVGGSEVRPTLD